MLQQGLDLTNELVSSLGWLIKVLASLSTKLRFTGSVGVQGILLPGPLLEHFTACSLSPACYIVAPPSSWQKVTPLTHLQMLVIATRLECLCGGASQQANFKYRDVLISLSLSLTHSLRVPRFLSPGRTPQFLKHK